MNTQRLVVLGLALVAAGGAALLVRSMLGGGTPKVEAKAAPAIASPAPSAITRNPTGKLTDTAATATAPSRPTQNASVNW